MKTTLIILAAGMSSRYGSLKQIDGFGPNNETIIDYSIHDAINSGFTKIIFVIRKSFEKEFKSIYNQDRYKNNIEVRYCLQDVLDIPESFKTDIIRTKPWGTNHAILCAKNVLEGEPFGVINADDFYGKDSFEKLFNFLKNNNIKNHYCVVGYNILETLSQHGPVSRAILDHTDNRLNSIIEVKEIYYNQSIENEDKLVSMNMFGFNSDYLEFSEKLFIEFLTNYINDEKEEFYIPSAVNTLINKSLCTMEVIKTSSKWFGVTYSEDRENVISKIKDLIGQNKYPEKLW